MPKLVVCSHNLRSNALRNLAEKLTEKLGYKVWRKYPHKLRPHQVPVTFLPGIDKIKQFQAFHAGGVQAPQFALSLKDAAALDSKQVVVRSLIDSSEGKGITIQNKDELNIHAPLYTAYIPKKKEFRVHVFNNEVIDIQEKRKRRVNGELQDFQVRNTANGYVFCRDNVNPPDDCASTALAAVKSLGRSYGAVDVIWNEKQNKSFVLEVNSRPGMEGTTTVKYADAIYNSLPQAVKFPPPRIKKAVKLQRRFRRG